MGELPSAAEHTDLFDFQLYPYASVYLGAEGMQGGEARDRIAGFWRVLGLEPPKDPDHLTVLLAAHGALLDRESSSPEPDRTNWRHVREVFLHEHLLAWLPLLLDKLERRPSEFHRRWASRLAEILATEEVAEELAGELPAALRLLEPLPDPRTVGGKEFLQALLAPGRAGFILTRDDLASIASEAGLGRRVGERHYVLKNVLGQDGPGVLRGLAALASESPLEAMPEITRQWWQARAARSRRLLEALAAES